VAPTRPVADNFSTTHRQSARIPGRISHVAGIGSHARRREINARNFGDPTRFPTGLHVRCTRTFRRLLFSVILCYIFTVDCWRTFRPTVIKDPCTLSVFAGREQGQWVCTDLKTDGRTDGHTIHTISRTVVSRRDLEWGLSSNAVAVVGGVTGCGRRLLWVDGASQRPQATAVPFHLSSVRTVVNRFMEDAASLTACVASPSDARPRAPALLLPPALRCKGLPVRGTWTELKWTPVCEVQREQPVIVLIMTAMFHFTLGFSFDAQFQ